MTTTAPLRDVITDLNDASALLSKCLHTSTATEALLLIPLIGGVETLRMDVTALADAVQEDRKVWMEDSKGNKGDYQSKGNAMTYVKEIAGAVALFAALAALAVLVFSQGSLP